MNPAILLHSLIVYQQTNTAIVVGQESLKVDANNSEFDLRDPDLPAFLSKYFSIHNLKLESDNILLSILLFQFSLNNGLINVVNNAPPYLENLPFFMQHKDIVLTQPFPFVFADRNLLVMQKNFPVLMSELDIALSNNIPISIANPALEKKNFDLMEELGVFSKIKAGTISDLLKIYEPDSLSSLYSIIESPRLLPDIVSATQVLIEQQGLKKELLLFIPRFVLDKFTWSISTAVELLYRIYKYKSQKHDEN